MLWLCLLCLFPILIQANYQPTWDSLDNRPLPEWYDKAKFGIFIHWGVFSVPSYTDEWFWWNWKGAKHQNIIDFMNTNYKPNFQYQDFAPQFTAEFYNPTEWANLFKASGAKYIVLVSKHHEGFTNWPSKVSWNWNSMDVGPKRDLVGELADAIRANTDIHFGLYHSLFEWFNPLYLEDKANGYKTQNFVRMKTMPELIDIVNKYKPDVVWSDGDWEVEDTYWNSTQFLAWLYNESPVKDTVVTNDRWGKGCRLKHGGFYSGTDRYNPGTLLAHKWENCMTIDKLSWGYRREANIEDYESTKQLLQTLVEAVSCNGNLLMNIGPAKDGTIHPVFQERLIEMGEWLAVAGEGIYESKPWKHQNDSMTPGVWYTANNGNIYCFFFKWPTNGQLHLASMDLTSGVTIDLLGYEGTQPTWIPMQDSGITVDLSRIQMWNLYIENVWVLRVNLK